MTSETEQAREGRTLDGQSGIVSARTTEDPRAVEVQTSSTSVLPENLQRRGLSLVNDSTQTIYVALGKAAVLHRDIMLLPGGAWDGRVGELLWLGEVTAIAAAEANLLVVEV